jgi:MerR family transcriptional regulator, light-induced transcriptional regulator
MRTFSINDLERMSGIRAHTIRAWEHRYQLLQPQRTDGNTRLYVLADVQALLDIVLLLGEGFRISEIAHYGAAELQEKIKIITTEKNEFLKAVHHLIIYKYKLDIEKFEEVLDSCCLQWGIDVTIEYIILPFLEKINLLAYTDGGADTHFAVTAIRQKIILGIEKTTVTAKPFYTALLFLPKGEHYDLILLYMAYSLKKKGAQVLYLGTNVPLASLETVLMQKAPDQLYTYIAQPPKPDLHRLSCFVAEQLPQTTFFAAVADVDITTQLPQTLTRIGYKMQVDKTL